MGRVAELATGFPGYDATIARANGFLSQILVEQGYATYAVGKWHLAPEDECHHAAPRHNWPLGRGFERFYGFLEGETHQFVPALISDNHQVEPPATPEDGYHLTEDLVDTAIGYVADLRAIDPDKPFFLYSLPGGLPLAPPVAAAVDRPLPRPLRRRMGRLARGAPSRARWLPGLLPEGTELSPRPDWVPAWDSLPPTSGGSTPGTWRPSPDSSPTPTTTSDGWSTSSSGPVTSTDTVLIVLSDNGASSEGGPTGSVNDLRPWNGAPRSVEEAERRIDEIGGPLCHNNYPWGWTVAGNTPFRRWKREVHEGGVADPLIVHWPAGTDRTANPRRQYVHAIDIMPTLLELLGIDAPDSLGGVAQSPVHGTSFAASLTEPAAPDRHLVQYYEIFGCRALYLEGWKAVSYHPIQDTSHGFEEDQWELYHVGRRPLRVPRPRR